jgi:hypothetical protein
MASRGRCRGLSYTEYPEWVVGHRGSLFLDTAPTVQQTGVFLHLRGSANQLVRLEEEMRGNR